MGVSEGKEHQESFALGTNRLHAPFSQALLNGGGGKGTGVRDIFCVARACAHVRHTDDTHTLPQTTLFVVSKSRLVASSARHLLVTEKNIPPI